MAVVLRRQEAALGDSGRLLADADKPPPDPPWSGESRVAETVLRTLGSLCPFFDQTSSFSPSQHSGLIAPACVDEVEIGAVGLDAVSDLNPFLSFGVSTSSLQSSPPSTLLARAASSVPPLHHSHSSSPPLNNTSPLPLARPEDLGFGCVSDLTPLFVLAFSESSSFGFVHGWLLNHSSSPWFPWLIGLLRRFSSPLLKHVTPQASAMPLQQASSQLGYISADLTPFFVASCVSVCVVVLLLWCGVSLCVCVQQFCVVCWFGLCA